MKKVVLVLMAVVLLGLPGGVRAEGVSVPNPESRWFAISWAFARVRHNFEVWTARTEEKKAELELRFIERENKLAEKIAKLEETNPEAAEKLGKVVEKLKEKRAEKMEKVEMRIERMGEKGKKFEQKMNERRKEMMGDAEDNDHEEEMKEMMDGKGGQMMESKGVRIRNAKPEIVE